MSDKTSFFFYLGAVICFVIAAAGEGWRFGRLGRRGIAPRLVLVPLGLALFVFPIMWDTGVAAF
ncbi:MAG TPA: hypothetical protein VHF00_03925 [Acidimicrobiales bacterium]|jgi:hypothetical protein|nr:hypothetical protein [Acidimicrobiales bacterium]